MEKRFYDYASLIIDNYEGGYYHPDMKSKLKNGSNMGASGETMFGIDKKNGGSDVDGTSGLGKKFWNIIKAADAQHTWSYGYRGGIHKWTLMDLAAEMMYARYEKYSARFSKKAKKLVAKSPKLETHFYYACWNGVKHFNSFADAINSAVAKGTTNLKKLETIAMNSRKNSSYSWMRERAKNLQAIWDSIPTIKFKRIVKTVLLILIPTAAVATGVYFWRRK